MPAKDTYHDSLRAALVKDGWTITDALGQFLLYRSILEEQDPDRVLFLAIPDNPAEVLDEPIGQLLIAKHLIRAVIFDPEKEELLRWI